MEKERNKLDEVYQELTSKLDSLPEKKKSMLDKKLQVTTGLTQLIYKRNIQ